MNIIHELNQLDFGGVERVIRNLIKYDQKNSHAIVAYKDGPFRKELEKVGARIIIAEKNEGLDVACDVLHIHSGGDVSHMAKDLGRAFPVVETIHSPIRSPMKDDIIFQRIGVTDVVSEMNSKCKTIRNGLDFDDVVTTFTREEVKGALGISVDMPVVGRLGRVGPDKGLEDWLLACYKLQQKGLDFVPVIVGGEARGHDGRYIGRLKLMCESLPVKNVVWVGHKTDIYNYFQIMDVFLYPSRTEGFGLVFIEALTQDCIVVTYKNPVTTELIGGYAILTEESIDGLVKGVEKALAKDMREALIGLGSHFSLTEYDAERMASEYQEVYERCNADFNRADQSETADAVSA